MAEYLIQLSGQAESFTINLGDKEVQIICKYNEQCGWIIDIVDIITTAKILSSIPLVSGVDLLEPFTDNGINGSLYVYVDGDFNAEPTFDTLGKTANLYFITG